MCFCCETQTDDAGNQLSVFLLTFDSTYSLMFTLAFWVWFWYFFGLAWLFVLIVFEIVVPLLLLQ